MKNKLNIALIIGGISPEREVSKSTGKSILSALKNMGHRVKLLDPAYGLFQPTNEDDFFSAKDFTKISRENYLEAMNASFFDDVDIAFIGLHGKYGEDGIIQAQLELRGVKYTGSGVLASAIAMDKSTSKILFQHYDVNTPQWFVETHDNVRIKIVQEKVKKFFGYPCIIKPNDQGSTIGLTVCRGDVEVESALSVAFQYSEKILIEEFIPGREITVGILDQVPLPVLEIVPKKRLYDYECKYTDGMSDYVVPALIPDDIKIHLQQQALLAFNSLGCKIYGRVDFRMTDDFKTYCLEVNTLPGMTSTSLVPKMAKASGISFENLIEKIITNSMK